MRLSTQVLLLLCGAYCQATAAAAPPAAEAFGMIGQTAQVVLSPDGNTLAWLDDSGPQSRVVVFDLATHKIRRTVQIDPPLKLRSLEWADSETLLYEVSYTNSALHEESRFEVFRFFAVDIGSGHAHPMLTMGQPAVSGEALISPRVNKPKTVIMSTLDYSAAMARPRLGSHFSLRRRDSGWVYSLYQVDTRTGNGAVVEQGTQFTADWVVDRDGKAVARSEWDPDGNVYRILVKRGLGWYEIFHRENRGTLSLCGLSEDGSAIVALGSLEEGHPKLLALPLDGSRPRVLLEDPDRDVVAVMRDRFRGTPVCVRLGGLEPRYHCFDPQVDERTQAIARSFPGRRVVLYSESQDGQRAIAYVDSPSLPATYYLVDFKTHRSDIVGEEYPKLAGAELGDVRILTYKARDGTTIPAYLTLPPGAAEKDLPLVVLPHGGPEDRNEYAFDWWAQFLATRGYAVFQPQFRGSTGFGDLFRLAGRKQWGGIMQDDVTDGVRSLIEQGVADARRICIVGLSYGGYAALAGVAFTPDLYACAVSVIGVSNLPELGAYGKEHWGDESSQVGYWRDDIGSPLDPRVAASSPVNAVAHINAPIMLMYSSDDTVVPPSQSRDMARALQRSGKRSVLVSLGHDDHWLSRSSTRVKMLKELDRFLAANLNP